MAHIIDGPNKEFASRLITSRRSQELTQDELAKKCNLDKRSISMYENGRTFPREDTLRHLARELDVDPKWLANGNSEETMSYIDSLNKRYTEVSQNIPKKVELIYIEEWSEVKNYTKSKLHKIYTETPKLESHCSELDKFIPVIKRPTQHLRAAKYPRYYSHNHSCKTDTIIVFDTTIISIDAIPSGSDVVFRLRGEENKPGLRKIIKEPGLDPILIPIEPSPPSQTIIANDINIEILGVVISSTTQSRPQ